MTAPPPVAATSVMLQTGKRGRIPPLALTGGRIGDGGGGLVEKPALHCFCISKPRMRTLIMCGRS
jgi:hypothetical protein